MRIIREFVKENNEWGFSLKNLCTSAIYEVNYSFNTFLLERNKKKCLNKNASSNIKDVTVLSFYTIVLLRGIGYRSLLNSSFFREERF